MSTLNKRAPYALKRALCTLKKALHGKDECTRMMHVYICKHIKRQCKSVRVHSSFSCRAFLSVHRALLSAYRALLLRQFFPAPVQECARVCIHTFVLVVSAFKYDDMYHIFTTDWSCTHCNIMCNTAPNCNTLQHIVTHCNTLQLMTVFLFPLRLL